MNKRHYSILLATVLMVGLGVWTFVGAPASVPAPAEAVVQVSVPERGAGAQASRNGAPAASVLAPSLQGTEVDGHFAVDDAGNLILTEDVRARFDYFLSVHGELSLDDYVGYNLHLQGYMAQTLAPVAQQSGDYYVDTLDATLDTLMALRRQYLGEAAAQAFFGTEEAYAGYAVARMRIQLDDSLSEAQKVAQLSNAQADMPQELVSIGQRTTLHADLDERTRALRDAGAPASDIQALREEMLGEAAAQALAAADQERAAWQARYEAYQRDRVRYAQARGLSEQDRRQQEQRLLERHFPPEEHALVRSRSRIDARAQESADQKG